MATDSYQIYCKIRDKLGYKDSAVATGAGITKSTFSDWKVGRYQPKDEKLQKIASFLGVSMEYLKTGEEPTFNYDYLYTGKNSDFLIEVTKSMSDNNFVDRIKKYMELLDKDRNSVNDFIDYLYEREHQGEV